jgi:hypothetical protein
VALDRRTGLFREEALEHHARSAKPGKPLHSGDRATTRGAPVVLIALLAATLAAFLLPATQTATGTVTGLGGPGIATLRLPGTARADLRPGLAVVGLTGPAQLIKGLTGPAQLIKIEPGVGDVTATARCTTGCAPGQRVTVVLGRRPVAAALVPSLQPLWEGGR